MGLAVDLYQETSSFSCYDRARVSGRPVDREAFYACAQAENLLQRQPSVYLPQLRLKHAKPQNKESGYRHNMCKSWCYSEVTLTMVHTCDRIRSKQKKYKHKLREQRDRT